jgi:hypothetical protein
VPRRYIKQLRQWLYYWETYGYDKSSFFRNIARKQMLKKGQPNMEWFLMENCVFKDGEGVKG